ncbi:ATP-binding protein [Candidatus Poriferisodalis sp.]|uniref:ATP-binding protein n=1 Tax=Candidatus Poriferisodalis sp. TaxID=3101277 RepID=UPI003B5BF429
MSESLQVRRLVTDYWGRASGFDLALPHESMVVLFGPNESGKTSAAAALAWLIAGPGTHELQHRFGAAGDRLAARMEGQLGIDAVQFRVTMQVPSAASRRVAAESFSAVVGSARLERAQLNARLGGGDLDSYRHLYWVEALDVADGSGLQETVSIRAVFGGVNPFTKADELERRAGDVLGRRKGRAARGSARELLDRVRSCEARLAELARTKSRWASIDGDLDIARRDQQELQKQLQGQQTSLHSARLALEAFQKGLVASLADKQAELADMPVPSAAERELLGRATEFQAAIGALQTANSDAETAYRQSESARSAVHGDWVALVDGPPLGEAGVDSAKLSEGRLLDAAGELRTAKANLSDRKARLQHWSTEAEKQRSQWNRRYPRSRSPERIARLGEARSGHDAGWDIQGRTADRTMLGRLVGTGTRLAGAGCVAAVTVLLALRGDWRTAVIAAVGTGATLLSLLRAWRSRSGLDEERVRLAQRLIDTEEKRHAAHSRLADADADAQAKRSLFEDRSAEYRDSISALGVPTRLIAQFEPDAVQHLKLVRAAQSGADDAAAAALTSARRLKTLRRLFADGHCESTLASEEQAHSSGVFRVEDATDAERRLDAVAERVDRYDGAAEASRRAADELQRAIRYDEIAMRHVCEENPSSLGALVGELEGECQALEDELANKSETVTDLMGERKSLESPDIHSAGVNLQRSELRARIEDSVMEGISSRLAARLLHNAAEDHRRTRQPALLERTGALAAEVADWANVTVDPFASDGAQASVRNASLLVEGPHGEHSAGRLSFGSQSLLYLALRLATIEQQSMARGVRLPVILDDVLVGLDDDRAERCIGVLRDFSEQHQTILLTCHRNTVERAEAAGAAVLTMP